MRKYGRGAETSVRRNIATGWSELSPETLLRIGKRLESRLDISRFRSVCKNWRASLPLPRNPSFLTPFFPRQIPNPISLPFNKQGYDNIDLVPISVFFVKRLDCQLDNDSKGWILTVEERQPGKIRLLYPISRDPISKFPKSLPKTLNLSDFRVSEIGKGYCFRSCSGSISDCKVVVYSDSAQQLYATATDFTAVVLYSLGNLFGLRLKGGFWKFERINSFLWFKDIICFKGTLYAVAGGGKLYVVDHLTFKVTDTVVDCFVCAPNCAIQLVESCQELLLVVKDDIKVYKLNVVLQKWEAVKTLGDRIMFLGIDCCFLLSTENLLWHKGNFIVSSSSLNSLRSKWVELTENFGIYISCLEDVVKKIHKTNFEAISCMLWPPPTWLPPDMSPPSRDPGKDEHVQVDIRSLASPTRPEIAFPVVKNELEEQIAVNQSPNFLSSSTFVERIVSDTVHRREKALEPETPENNALSGSKAPKMQHSWKYASMLKLSGIDVQSDFLPVLEKIWVKHGDVVEGSAIRSCDTKATALESLAKMVIILKSNSGKTLSEDHAQYLGSTLSDLQLMHLKIDWLVPFVEKALALHKRMKLEAVLMEIDKAIVMANAIEHNFLEKIAEVKQVLDRDKKIVFDCMSVFGPIEQEQCLDKLQNNNRPRSISWSELPLELLRSIAKSFKNNPNDLRNFRAVCKKWRRSTSISVLLPYCDYSTLSYNLFTSSVLLLGPPSGSGSSSGSHFDTPWMVSVVEITKGNIQLCHPFSQTPHSKLLKNFDVTQFHPSVLTESYHIASSSDISLSSALAGVDKVVVFSTRPIPRINDCLLLVLHNGRLGGYPSFEAEDDMPEWVDVSYRGVDDFDDIVTFKGVIYAVDWEGKLYQLFNHKIAVQKTLVSAAVSDAGAYKGWRKRLVGSDQKLHLFVRYQKDMLKVFKLSKHGKIWNWVMVQSFEEKDQVLFMSTVYGFFVPARYIPDCQLRNCVVFSDNAFPIYSFRGWVSAADVKVEEEIMVFQLGTRDDQNTFRPISSYPNFPVKLWSPPSWVLQPQTSSPLQLHSDQRHSEVEEMQLDREQAAAIPPPNSAALETENTVDPIVQSLQTESFVPRVIQPVVNQVSTPKFQGIDVHPKLPILQKISSLTNFPVKLQSPPSSVLQPQTSSPLQPHSDQRHSVVEEMRLDREQAAVIPPPNSAALEAEKTVDPAVQKDSVIPRVIQPVVIETSTPKFQCVDVHPEHLPILQKIWKKHGDVLKESKICSCDFIATTLASLAKLILILQTNSGKTLTDNQARYLTSALSDLQSVCVKVDWLVPFVEKALALHKRKPLDAALVELEKAKAKVEEMNRKFLLEMAKMKQGFSTNKKQIVSKSISACVPIDQDKCLAEGLF